MSVFLSRGELEEIFGRADKIRLGVVGDFCLDIYLTIDSSASEVSVETGLVTQPVREEHHYLGGGGNVIGNLVSLGVGSVEAFGVVGRDLRGEEIRDRLEGFGVETSGLIFQDSDWDTSAYTKLYENGVEDKRIDYGNFNRLNDKTADRLLDKISDSLGGLDLVVVNQQLKHGIHTDYFRRGLRELIKKHENVIFVVDSRDFSDEFDGAYRKINVYEGARILGREYPPGSLVSLEATRDIGFELYNRWKKPLFLTRGENGLLVYTDAGVTGIPGMMFFSRIDPVGAGDSLLAGLALALALGYDPAKAGFLGNLVAGVTVQKLFKTGTASAEEVLDLYDNAMYRLRPELAVSLKRAKYLAESEIEIVTNPPPANFRIIHAVFDHDGTISTLRQGWESVMERVMLEAILGDRYSSVGEVEFEQVRERVLEYIDKTTGVQTLVQMQGLVELVREFGYVNRDRVLDEYGYKAIYLRALKDYIRNRIEKFERGELDVSDLTLKGAVAFLKLLYDRGILLYLASGTDVEDVRKEAELLGYGRFFGERIYGATDSTLYEPKRMVVKEILTRRIVSEESLSGVVVFGDGPVEIREGFRMGCYTVGVASDEVRRYGLNLSKRRRLVEAGADLVIPDFSQGRLLEKLFF